MQSHDRQTDPEPKPPSEASPGYLAHRNYIRKQVFVVLSCKHWGNMLCVTTNN